MVLQRPSAEFGQMRRGWIDLLSHRQLDIKRWSRRLEDGEAGIETVEIGADDDSQQAFRSLLHEQPEDVVLLCSWKHDRPSFEPSGKEDEDIGRVTLLCVAGAQPQLDALTASPEAPAEADELASEVQPQEA